MSPSKPRPGEKTSDPGTIAHFEVLGRLGAGGMGVVYRARDEVLEREVALKLIRPEVAADDEVRRRFLREARLAAAISHPGVATLFEAGEVAGEGAEVRLYLASELVRGRSLERELKDGPLPVERVVDVGIQLADALAAAHVLGIVHRDIKPSNLMVTEDGRLKVLDFGIAKRVAWDGADSDSASTLTCTAAGRIVGTPAYMAPEQVTGGAADVRTDIHGVGCVLYHLLTGHAPFGAGSPSEVMRRVMVTPPRPLAALRADVPRALAAVVERALAKDPNDRFQTADELAAALRAVASGALTVTAAERLRRSAPRWAKWLVPLAALVLAAFLVGRALPGDAIDFANRDWLLVADVVDETGEEGLALALKSALETDLRQSRHLNVFDSSQLRNTLKLMRREPTVPIDLETGLEVCRFAGIRALLVPQINVTDDVYILQASLIDPTDGRTADRIRLTAQGRDTVLLETIDTLTRQVRRRLGESLRSIADTDPPLAQYTTSSWEALRLFSLGTQEWAASRMEEAASSFELALEKDPDFAMARGSLGLVFIQFLGRAEEGRRLIAQALEDASEVSQREYLHLRAVHRQFVEQDFEAALADYGLMSRLYPDAVAPYNNSGRILQTLGRSEEALEMYRKAREADPRSPFPLYNMWTVLNIELRRPVAAEEVARSLLAMQPDSPWARHALSWSLVSQRRFAEAEEAARSVLEVDPVNIYASGNLAHLMMRRRAWDEAAAIYRDLYDRSHASEAIGSDLHDTISLALALRGAGRPDEAEKLLTGDVEAHAEMVEAGTVPYRYPCLLAALGRAEEARSLARAATSAAPDDPLRAYAEAEALSLLGDTAGAMTMLERAVAIGYDDPYLFLIDPLLAAVQDRSELERLAPPA